MKFCEKRAGMRSGAQRSNLAVQVSTLLIVLLSFDTWEFQLGLKEHWEPDDSCEGDPLGRLKVRRHTFGLEAVPECQRLLVPDKRMTSVHVK